jgi:hypothetical protein
MSFVITMVGAILFFIPPGTQQVVWTPFLIAKITLATFIAALSPYIVWNSSRNLALTYSGTFDKFMNSMIVKTHDKMTEQVNTSLQNKVDSPPLTVSTRNTVTQPYKFANP